MRRYTFAQSPKAILRAAAILLLLMLTACSPAPEATPTPTTQPTPTRLPPTAEPTQTLIPEPISQSTLAAIRERGTINVGVLYNYPPFGFLAESGEVDGYEVDLMRAIAEKWEVDVNFVQVTRQTRFTMLREGQIDMLAAAVPHTRQYEPLMEFSATTFVSGYVILAPESAAITAPADLAGLTVVATSPVAREALQALSTPPAQIIDVAAPEDAVPILTEQAEVDAIVGRREAMMLASDTAATLAISEEFLLREPYAFAFRKGDTALRDLVNLTLQQVVNEGTYGELYRNNIYGYAADVFPTLPGTPTYTFADFPPSVLEGDSVVERISRGEPVRVAGLDLAESPAAFDSQPIIDGYNRAVINEMARRWNVPVTEIPDSAGQRGLQLLQNGEADLVVGVRPSISLIGDVSLTTPYYQRALRLFHMDDVTVFGVGDLEFRPTLALTPQEVSTDLIQDNNAFPDPRPEDSLEEAFRTLTLRAVDAAVADEYIAALMAQADARIEIYETRYRPADYVMAVSPTDADFQELVNITLQDMAADGTLQRFAEQYFLPYRPEGEEIEQFIPEIWPESPLN